MFVYCFKACLFTSQKSETEKILLDTSNFCIRLLWEHYLFDCFCYHTKMRVSERESDLFQDTLIMCYHIFMSHDNFFSNMLLGP